MPLNQDDKKRLRTIGHQLKPVVTVAGNGLSESVREELNRALDDHELIKVKFAVGDRAVKQALIQTLCQDLQAELVQAVGNVALILRPNPKANPRLSNLRRH